MPQRLKTRCRFPRCGELVRGHRFCDVHRPQSYRWQDDRRGTAAERGYDHVWAKTAELRRRMDSYLCQPCLKHQRMTPGKIVDHIVPVHVRPDWRLNVRNTQVICPVCHQRKTTEDNQQFGSSTATFLTLEQLAAREVAQKLVGPPRSDVENGDEIDGEWV